MKRRRPHIHAMVKLHAALYQLGLEPHAVELDHDPALALRPVDPETGDTIPPANDPKFLVWRTKADHKLKTTGRRGESKLCDISNGDIHRAAKVKRIRRRIEQATPHEFGAEAAPSGAPKRKIPSRPFQKRKK
jgi:hypothetical protein